MTAMPGILVVLTAVGVVAIVLLFVPAFIVLAILLEIALFLVVDHGILSF
jgi:hypothetical protein